MGQTISSLLDKLGFGVKEHKVLFLGLDNAGKTTMLYNFRIGEVIDTVPTIGFNVETVNYKNVKFTCWDVGGQKKIRALWRHYFRGADALIFVVDSADTGDERMTEAREELHSILGHHELAGAKVLVMANKQDMATSVGADKLAEALNMHSLHSHEWYVQACSASRGHGLYEGLDWLSHALKHASK